MGGESNFTFTASAPPPSRHSAAPRDHVPSLVPEEECEPVSSVPGLSVGSLKGGFLPRLTLSAERIGIVRMPGAAEGWAHSCGLYCSVRLGRGAERRPFLQETGRSGVWLQRPGQCSGLPVVLGFALSHIEGWRIQHPPGDWDRGSQHGFGIWKKVHNWGCFLMGGEEE